MPAATTSNAETLTAFPRAEALPQVARIPHKSGNLLGVDSLPVPADVPAPVKAAPEPPRATTVDTRTYPDARKVAAQGLHAEIASRASLAAVAREMSAMPKTRDDKTPIEVQRAQFVQAQEQAIADAVIGRLLEQGFRIYPDGLHCEDCRTPLDEAQARQAADMAFSRTRMVAEILAESKDMAKLNARAVLVATEDAATAWKNKDREGWQSAMATLCDVLFPVED